MDVDIGEVVSTVRAVDGDALLSPQTLNKIVAAVQAAIQDRQEHDQRARAERRVTGGVREELEAHA